MPVISYRNSTLGALRVTKCGNPACTVSVSRDVDDHATASVGADGSIGIGADGLPVISHRRHGEFGALRVTKCGTAGCQ